MKPADDTQLRKIEEDIGAIKSVLKKNIPMFRMLVNPNHLRLFSLIMGLLFFIVPGIYYYLIEKYGGYQAIPSTLRTVMLFIVAFAWVIMGIAKNLLWMRSIGKKNHSLSWSRALREIVNPKVVHVYIPVLAVAIILIYFLVDTGNTFYIIPACAIGSGFLYNVIGTLGNVWQYLVTGYWFTVSGILLLLNPIPAPIALMVSFGVGLILFSISSIRGGHEQWSS